MRHAWQLQEAKNKFSSLVERAQHEGPQVVTKHGKEVVVILSSEDYRKLAKPKVNLFKFIQNSPLGSKNIDISRDKSIPRDVVL
jgi:prevent-host-death family protein